MTQIKEGAAKDGHMLDSPDEMYKWFNAQVPLHTVTHYRNPCCRQVIKNLHVVFTMNPSADGLRDRALVKKNDLANAKLKQMLADQVRF